MEQKSSTGSAAENRPNVERLMAEIRERVRRDLADSVDRTADYQPHQARSEDDGAHPVLYSEELNYLNANWGNWYQPVAVSSHRRLIGRALVKFKTKLRDWAWNYLLRDYCERERQYQMNLVRFLNATAKYIDARDAHIFWELVHKVDYDVQGLNERANRLYDEAMGTARSMEIEISRQAASREESAGVAAAQTARLNSIEDVTRGLERTTALLAKAYVPVGDKPVESRTPPLSNHSETQLLSEGVDYLLLENRYRGSEELIRERLAAYLPIFSEVRLPIVELGCGRGEFLELLKSAGKNALGLDIDEAMIQRCREKSLPVERVDALSYLQSCEDRSLGGVFSAQLVEHLSRQDLDQLLALLSKKVVHGGPVVLETINPQSITALCRNFFRDPTHVWPLHPDTLQFMLEMKGLATERVIYGSPYPLEAVLQEIKAGDELPPRWRALIQAVNDNSKRLNDLLFGYQDYAIVARGEDRGG